MYFNWSTYQFEEVVKAHAHKPQLHDLLIKDEPTADDVQALINDDPNAVKKKGKDGLLPLHTAVLVHVSVEVIHVLLEADPSAAEKTGKFRDEHMSPLHFAIREPCSIDIIQALLDAYPKGAETRITKEGKLPLSLSLEVGASDDVVLAMLSTYPDAAKDCGLNNDPSKLPLITAIRKKRSLEVVNALQKVYPDGAKTRLSEGELPLSLAIATTGITYDVILAVLEAYPDAAMDTVSNNSPILPLHLAILRKHSLAIIQALLDVYPKAAETIVKWKTEQKLPLTHALTSGVSDDVVLAILATYPDAAKTKSLYYYGLEMLPMHFAVRERRSQKVVKALLDANPGAAKEIKTTKNLPLHDAINMKASKGVILLLVNAYPQAVKKRMEDGRLSIDVCAANNASDELMLALLKVDMPLRINDGTPVGHSGSWISCVAAQTDGATGAVRRILFKSESGCGFGKHIHALADVCDAEGRSALRVASSGSLSAIYEHLLFSGRYRLRLGPPVYRSKTSVVLRAQDLNEQADYGVIFDNWDTGKHGKLDRKNIATKVEYIGLDSELFWNGFEDNESISKEDFVDICKRQLEDVPRDVVIKLMQNKHQWERECNARKVYNLGPKYVVSALSNLPSENAIADSVCLGDGGLDTIVTKFLGGNKPGKHAIVMKAANRNLHQIFHQEKPEIDDARVMLKQVFLAVKHLHEKRLMHGDIKMSNIVRFRIDNQLRLIDLDASARIVPIDDVEDSFAGAKFSSAILPPEMIERIETEEQLKEFNKYWEDEHDKDLLTKIAPKLYKEQGIVKARYVVKSFRTEGGKPLEKGLPFKLVRASESIDAWALGVLVFTMLTGETLVPSTREDDCTSGKAMYLLHSWGTQPEMLSEVFNKINDDAARDLVQQLLQKEPEKRPTAASLLATHPFFHPKRNDEEMKGFIHQMNARLEDVDNTLQSQAKQLKMINANNLVIKKLGDESKAELFRTRHALLKSIFEANGVKVPLTFIIVHNKLPPKLSDEKMNKILGIITAQDSSGGSIDISGDLKEYRDHIEIEMKWAKRIRSVSSIVTPGEEVGAFEAIKEGIKDFISGKEMYLYLIDELTGEPVRAEGWPLTITDTLEIVPKLLPLKQVGMRAMPICNGTSGLARMFGYPLPKVPKDFNGAQESIELLKEQTSVEQLWYRACSSRGSYCGASLRAFVDFLNKNDPGLSNNRNGDFAGLYCISDPEDGTALWTTLTDPVAIQNALQDRARQRREEEQPRHIEHNIQSAVKKHVDTSATANQDAPAIATSSNCCTKFMMMFGC